MFSFSHSCTAAAAAVPTAVDRLLFATELPLKILLPPLLKFAPLLSCSIVTQRKLALRIRARHLKARLVHVGRLLELGASLLGCLPA